MRNCHTLHYMEVSSDLLLLTLFPHDIIPNSDMAHSFDAITNPPPDLGGGLRHLLILTLSPSERIRLDYPSLYKSGRDQKDESDIRKQAILLWTPGNSVLPMKGKSSIPGTFFSYHIIPIRFYRDYCHQNYDTSMTQYNAQ